MKRHLVRTPLLLALALGASLSAAACGGDDDNGGGAADCSKCSDEAECNQTFSDCLDQGGNASQCQEAVDLLCSFDDAFGGDGGLGGGFPSPDGG